MYGFFNPFAGVSGGSTPQPSGQILYGTTEYWNSQQDLISQSGVLYIYSDAKNWNGGKAPRLKVGNGILKLNEMPFIDEYEDDPGEPIYVNPETEDIMDPGVQDIFYNPLNESASFSNRTNPSSNPDNETITFNF